MTAFGIILILIMLLGITGAVHPRTRRLFVKPNPKMLIADTSSQETDTWIRVFREIVIASDGKISPEIEAVLTAPEERQRLLIAAKSEAVNIIETAESEAQKIKDSIIKYQCSDEIFASMLFEQVNKTMDDRGFGVVPRPWSVLSRREKQAWLTIAEVVRKMTRNT